MSDPDAKAMTIAQVVSWELHAGYDADALFGALLPMLVALACEHLGHGYVLAQLEQLVVEMRAAGDEESVH